MLTPNGTNAARAFVFDKFAISSSPNANAKVFSSANKGGAIFVIATSLAFDSIPPVI